MSIKTQTEENEVNKQSSDEETQIANKYLKTHPSLVIREMQIKIALRFPLTPVSVAVNQKIDETNTGEDVGK